MIIMIPAAYTDLYVYHQKKWLIIKSCNLRKN